VSIILPIKNRARNARALLSRILAQRCDTSIEIIAVDSGSTDGTVAVLADAGATVYSVPPLQFDYGLTRNAAALRAQGDVFVFVTSTMLPADDSWLRCLLAAYDSDEALAGVYSRSIPRQDADVLNYRDYLLADLRTNRREATVRDGLYTRSIADRDSYDAMSPERRRHLMSFSNVSAAIRPSVFRQIPFRSVTTCGEDMLWAREVLEAGYRIGHATQSVVLYSHNYTWDELFQRSFDDAAGSAAFAGMQFDDAAVVPTILGNIRNDWNYLVHGCQLRGDALTHWKVQSVVRRCAQVVGQWMAGRLHHPDDIDNLLRHVHDLPGGGDVAQEIPSEAAADFRPPSATLLGVPYGRVAATAFKSAPKARHSPSAVLHEVEAAVVEDWAVQRDAMSPGSIEAQIDIAIRGFAWSAGSWLGSF
jgi:rhamnosyltransferase